MTSWACAGRGEHVVVEHLAAGADQDAALGVGVMHLAGEPDRIDRPGRMDDDEFVPGLRGDEASKRLARGCPD
ncbi:MAG: hypothetical protein EA388_08775 [Nitriliruptor sp.]|nr:MAG: hypothetical protein EA388_08775 [Nitriliruptor sp.]